MDQDFDDQDFDDEEFENQEFENQEFENQEFENQEFENQEFGDQEFEESQGFNPWFSIWLQPRATMQQILDTDPVRWVLLLSIIGGFFEALTQAATQDHGDRMASWHGVVWACAIFGPLSGVLGLFGGGYLLRKSGGWLGGSASDREVRAAIAWGGIPKIWLGLLWIPSIALFGDENFTSATPRLDGDPALASAMLFLALIGLIGTFWSIVIWLKCLGQAHKFSAWRALGSVLLMILVIVAVFVVPLGLLFLLGR